MLVNLNMHILEFHGELTASNDDVLPTTVDLNKRWTAAEQPIFLLAFVFHPKYRSLAVQILKQSENDKGKWKETRNTLSCGRLADATMFYYGKHELFIKTDPQERKEELGRLRMSAYMWMTGQQDETRLFPYTDQYKSDPTVWYDYNENAISTELINFAKFLLGIPGQGASCERLFKDFSRFMTKTRNRLSHDKLKKTTMVKYDMKEKYPQDEQGDCKPLFVSNNRFISPKEHPRVDIDAEEENKEEEAEEIQEVSQSDRDLDEDMGELPVNLSETELPESIVGRLPTEMESPELRAMLSAIILSSPDDTEELFDWDEDEVTAGTSVSGAIATGMDAADAATADDLEAFVGRFQAVQTERITEHPHETRPDELQPLPIHNVVTYPQEDIHYFKRKKYVRKDKYDLIQIAKTKDIKFPSTMDAFA